MFDIIRAIWSTVEFVALWSGVSVGAIVALAALFYFVAPARQFAVQCVILVVVAWSCLMHGHIEGRSDEDARLQILSDGDDKNAATDAAADDKARAADIEAKAKAQHEQDLAEIARLGAGCPFDPDAGSMQPRPDDKTAVSTISDKSKPATIAKPARKSPAGSKAGQGLHLPLVWEHWLQGEGHHGNAAPDGK